MVLSYVEDHSKRRGAKIIVDVGDSEMIGSANTEALLMEWSEMPWDTVVMGFPVIQINRIELREQAINTDMLAFETFRDEIGCGLVSCRLSSDNLRESIFVEDHGFRFIEMVCQPELPDLQDYKDVDYSGLTVRAASQNDMGAVLNIARTAFHNERFHVDPRINSELGNHRYGNWVKNSLLSNKQELYLIFEMDLLIAFFVTEQLSDGTCYWHLNAVNPKLQGKGYGRRSWQAMVNVAKKNGAQRVRTSIVARNYRVMNLYSSLGFRFLPPMMTFHWVRTD